MRTIIVDNDAAMLRTFARKSAKIEGINLIGQFNFSEDALEFAKRETVDLAVLETVMPGMSGLELAGKLKKIRPNIMIVFITEHDNYIRQANELDADAYIMKPYNLKTLKQMANRMKLLSRRLEKNIFVQTFGRFVVMNNQRPVPLTGKAKEILALVITKCGKEISNEEIYSTIWENRECDNDHMKVYFNALRRLKDCLAENGIREILISTARGQMANTEIFDCDYYDWINNNLNERERFEGEFLSEYSWGEYILSFMFNSNY